MDKHRWIIYLAICISIASVAVGFENIDELLTKSEVFRQFEKRLSELEDRDVEQQRMILKLTNELAEQKRENTVLRDTVAGQKEENIVLRETVAELKTQFDHKNEIHQSNNTTQTSSPRWADQEHTKQRRLHESAVPTDMKRRISRLSRGISKRQINQAAVAFSSALTHGLTHVGINQNIIFDKVTTNIANGYNSHHGVFNAPVPGTYVFFSSILAGVDREVACRFVVNGVGGPAMWARGTDGRHDQGSNMIIVQLNQGDDVSVQNLLADDNIYSNTGLYTTFSGFLLQGEGEASIIG